MLVDNISSSSVFAYNRTSSHKPNTNDIVELSGIDTHDSDDVSISHYPAPVYSISRRLLAVAVRPPRPDSPHRNTALQPRIHVRASSTPFGISQANLENVAIKVGSILSGVKSLTGMAYNVAAEYARSRSSPSGVPPATGGTDSPCQRP